MRFHSNDYSGGSAPDPSTSLHDNAFYLSQQNNQESNARSYPRRFPIALTKAKGVYVTDAQGKDYIDCLAGAGSLALGHNHPLIIESLQNFLGSGAPLHTLDLMTPAKARFMDELFATLPGNMAQESRVQFCGPAGTDAIEAAIKLAKIATGRESIISFHGAYHGMTHGALSLMGNLDSKSPIPGLMPHVHFMPYPYAYRCPFGLGEDGAKIAARYFEHCLKDPESGITKPAAVVLEAIQGEGGVIPAPKEWLREIRRVTEELEIPLIIDEIQTGVGKTGSMYAFEDASIEPDMIAVSKSIGGSLPMALVIYNKKWDKWGPGHHAGTFRGNQLAMVAGASTLEYIRSHDLIAEVAEKGAKFKAQLEGLIAKHPSIGEVRGRGLMLGMEVVDPTAAKNAIGSYPADGAMAKRVQKECLSRGLILEAGGRGGCVMRFLPPLIIEPNELNQIVQIMDEAFTAARIES